MARDQLRGFGKLSECRGGSLSRLGIYNNEGGKQFRQFVAVCVEQELLELKWSLS